MGLSIHALEILPAKHFGSEECQVNIDENVESKGILYSQLFMVGVLQVIGSYTIPENNHKSKIKGTNKFFRYHPHLYIILLIQNGVPDALVKPIAGEVLDFPLKGCPPKGHDDAEEGAAFGEEGLEVLVLNEGYPEEDEDNGDKEHPEEGIGGLDH
ncbi:hypothetical protein Ahy_A03g011567 isoform C [Arachis hypogaea]|uniref:Uncharacterized protein n=1 Tax=Arachis hypogaea TaxID=3818 RepID=A0A445DR35_ARAHY|nr:hypothetical protein Ahy_A03g011567 isoform C [Arachis hypogaea]